MTCRFHSNISIVDRFQPLAITFGTSFALYLIMLPSYMSQPDIERHLPLKLLVIEDGLTAETGLTTKCFVESARHLPYNLTIWDLLKEIGAYFIGFEFYRRLIAAQVIDSNKEGL